MSKLLIASQRKLIESIQDKLADPKQANPRIKARRIPRPSKQNQNLTSRCQILEQINEETVQNTRRRHWNFEKRSCVGKKTKKKRRLKTVFKQKKLYNWNNSEKSLKSSLMRKKSCS